MSQSNLSLLKKCYKINIIYSALFGVLLLFISKNQIRANKIRMIYYENYYIAKDKIKYAYTISILLLFVLVIVTSVILNSIFSEYSFMSNRIIAVNILILALPTIIFLLCNLRKDKKNVF